MENVNVTLQKAIIFATLKHKSQTRKGTDIPYIVHPMEVMQILTAMGMNEKTIIAGILHDTLEDTGTKPEEIKELFGEDVLCLVQSESEDKSKTWKERKQRTIDEIKTSSLEVCAVCLADKLSNVRSIYRDRCEIGEKIWERFNASKKESEWYYTSIAESIGKATEGKASDAFNKYLEEFRETVKEAFCD